MLKVSGQIARLKIDARRYRQAVLKKLEGEQKKAVEAWVLAVIAKVPVYTGTAKGTFAPVGRTVGLTIASITNTTGKKNFIYKGRVYPLGFEKGADYQAHSLDVKVTGSTAEYIFRFTEKLPYVVWNTLYPASMKLKNATPWFAIQSGAAAYERYAREEIPKNIPSYTRFLNVKVVRVV